MKTLKTIIIAITMLFSVDADAQVVLKATTTWAEDKVDGRTDLLGYEYIKIGARRNKKGIRWVAVSQDIKKLTTFNVIFGFIQVIRVEKQQRIEKKGDILTESGYVKNTLSVLTLTMNLETMETLMELEVNDNLKLMGEYEFTY